MKPIAYVALAAIWFVGLAILSDVRSEAQQSPSATAQRSGDERQTATPKAAPAPQTGQGETARSNASADWTKWAVIVAIISAGIIACQSWQTKKAAEATQKAAQATLDIVEPTRKSAEAAMKSANALVNSERAWIVETIKFPERIPTQTQMAGAVVCVTFAFENIGKQPALIRNIQTRFHAADGPLPSKPEYRQSTLFPPPEIGDHGMLLAPGKPFYCRTFLEEGSFDDGQIAHIQGKRRPDLGLYAYGRIHYETMGLNIVNQFCYSWHNLMGFSFEGDKEGFRRGGPSEYNRHT